MFSMAVCDNFQVPQQEVSTRRHRSVQLSDSAVDGKDWDPDASPAQRQAAKAGKHISASKAVLQ